MADLDSMLSKVLNDPDSMEKIFSLAKSLGAQPPVEAHNTPTSVTPDAAVTDAMTKMLSGAMQGDGRRNALLAALRPFLRPERQHSLDRAMQAAKLSGLARLVLQNLESR